MDYHTLLNELAEVYLNEKNEKKKSKIMEFVDLFVKAAIQETHKVKTFGNKNVLSIPEGKLIYFSKDKKLYLCTLYGIERKIQ